MAEYSRVAKGHFTNNASTVSAQVINIPFQPDRVKMWNQTLYNSNVADSEILKAVWDVSMGQGTAIVEGYSSGGAWIGDFVPTNGISTFAAGQLLQYGPFIPLGTANAAGIAKTSGTVLTVTVNQANAVVPGEWIVFQGLYETSV